MTTIKFHPDLASLSLFAKGELDPSTSIMLSAHVEFCADCKQKLASLEEAQAFQLQQTATNEQDSSLLDGMFAQLLAQAEQHDPTCAADKPRGVDGLQLGAKRFALPRALQDHTAEVGPWSKLPGKLQRAKVNTHGKAKMNFIYMDEQSALPEHSHKGREITLVLSGEFEDEQGCYVAGDYIVQGENNQHSPRTAVGQDCLCLTLLDAPLHFSSGLASLLNPFSQLFFR